MFEKYDWSLKSKYNVPRVPDSRDTSVVPFKSHYFNGAELLGIARTIKGCAEDCGVASYFESIKTVATFTSSKNEGLRTRC